MDPIQRRNTVLFAVGEGLFGFKTNLVASATVLTVLLRRYGASERLLGAVWGIEAAGALLPQLLGLYLFHTYRQRRRRLILWHIVVMIPAMAVMALLAGAADRLDPGWFRLGMVLCHAHYWLCIGVVNAAWSDFVAALFPVAIRGTVMGLCMASASVAGAAGALAAGALLRASDTPPVYAGLYAAAWLVGTVSLCLWIPVDDRVVKAQPDTPPPAVRILARHFWRSLADGNFRAFVATRVLATLGFCVTPFIALRFLAPAGGGLAASTVVSCGAAMTAGFALASIALGPLGDRRGHRLGLIVGITAQMATLMVLLWIPGLVGCVLAYAGTGICNACAAVSGGNLLFETCPHGHRMAHISVGNLLIGTPMAVVAVFAGILAEHHGLDAVFMACLAASAMAMLCCLCFVRDPRTLPLRSAQG